MNAWFFRAPWWQLALGLGGPIAVVQVLAERLLRDTWTEAAFLGTVRGLAIGAVIGVVVARRNRRAREAVGSDDPRFLTAAIKAARRGPVPRDPSLREAARRVALVQVEQLRGQRRWLLLGLLVGSVLALVVVGLAPRVGWVLLAFWGLLAIVFVGASELVPRRLERRAEVLGDPSAGEERSGGMLAR